MDVSTLVLIGVALFLLWWWPYEDERIKRRRQEREAEFKRLTMIIEHGIDPADPDLLEDMQDWLHWHQHGRGAPYSAPYNEEDHLNGGLLQSIFDACLRVIRQRL